MNREEQILLIVQEVVEAIMTDIGSVGDLFDNAQKAGLLESILARLAELGISLAELFPVAIAEQYDAGMKAGNAALVEAGIVTAGAAGTAGAIVATIPQKRIHVEALDALISGGMGDLSAAIQTIKDKSPGKLDQILGDVTKELGTVILTGENRKKATARVSQVFAREALTCFTVEDKNGNIRNLPLDFYAATVTKTKLRTAHNTGSINRYIENDCDLVIVDPHFPTCKHCAARQGIVISLSGDTPGYPSADEVGLPPYHPNCRHAPKPYNLKGKTKEEIAEDKRRKFKPEKDTRTEAQKKAYNTEQAIRRKANQEKKDYEKLKAVLGADKVPKTLGAFRRLRRKNDLGWKQLQIDYRNAIKISDEEREA